MVKIEKRSFDATDDEVAAEVLRISMTLTLGGLEPTLMKIKQDLKCSEADLVLIIKKSEALVMIESSKPRGSKKLIVLPSQRYFPKTFSDPENITADVVRQYIIKAKEKEKEDREKNINRIRESKT